MCFVTQAAAYIYMMSTMVEDEETQKRGIVVLATFPIMTLSFQDLKIMGESFSEGDLNEIVPIKVKAIHIWAKSLAENQVVQGTANQQYTITSFGPNHGRIGSNKAFALTLVRAHNQHAPVRVIKVRKLNTCAQ